MFFFKTNKKNKLTKQTTQTVWIVGAFGILLGLLFLCVKRKLGGKGIVRLIQKIIEKVYSEDAYGKVSTALLFHPIGLKVSGRHFILMLRSRCTELHIPKLNKAVQRKSWSALGLLGMAVPWPLFSVFEEWDIKRFLVAVQWITNALRNKIYC